ncbi:MADF domain-containing protein [Camponotus japonicus]
MESEKVNDLTQEYEYEYNVADTDTILIDLVKNFPHLYDKSVADFKNIHKKDRAWMKISSILKLPVADCQSRWQRLREKFSREKKKREAESRSGSEASKRSTFSLYDQMKFLDSFVKSRKTYTNFIPKGTHFPMEKEIQRNIPQKLTIASSNSSEILQPLSPLSSLSPSPPPQLSISTASSSSSTLASTALLESSTLLPNNEMCVPSIKPCMQVMSKHKKEDKENRKRIREETDEIEKSLVNLSSIVSRNYLEKQKMDEDDYFSQTIAHELRKRKEPKKMELKGKIMKILYEL